MLQCLLKQLGRWAGGAQPSRLFALWRFACWEPPPTQSGISPTDWGDAIGGSVLLQRSGMRRFTLFTSDVITNTALPFPSFRIEMPDVGE